MKRLLLTLFLLSLGLVPTLAQEVIPVSPEEAAQGPQISSLIDTVKVIAEKDQPALLIFGTMPDSCERDTFVSKDRQNEILFVDVYHAPVPSGVVPCPEKVIPIAVTLPVEELLTLDENSTLPTILAVNDHYYRIEIAQIEPVGTPPAVPPITLTPLKRVDVPVDALTPQEGDDGLTDLHIEGILPSGCSDSPFIHVAPMFSQTSAYAIDVFQLLDDPMMCPDTYVAVQYDIVFKTSIKYDDQSTFILAASVIKTTTDYNAPLPSPNGDTMIYVPHIIQSVDAVTLESLPAHMRLMVNGYQPDGCEAPVQITQSREGTTVTVEIFREIPSDVMCPMSIQSYDETIDLEGTFESGTYTINVNGTIITMKI